MKILKIIMFQLLLLLFLFVHGINQLELTELWNEPIRVDQMKLELLSFMREVSESFGYFQS